MLRPLRELLSFEEAEEDLEDQETEIEEAEMSNEGKKFTTFSHSQMKHYFFSYLPTWKVDLSEILEIMAQMWQYVIFLSLKPTKVTSDFILY